jgi:hypothetical protein
MSAMRVFVFLLLALQMCARSHAAVISGTATNLPNSQLYLISVGPNTAELYWSADEVNSTANIYAYTYTDVGIATGITNITQITNAAVFPLQTDYLTSVGPVPDAAANGGIGTFIILRNSSSGYYAVVRIDDVHSSQLDVTWWLQTDGSGDFSSYVAPGPLAYAVDAPDLVWITGGNANWTSQTTITYDGIDAAQSGFIDNNEVSFIQTSVQGPGTLLFKWRVSSEDFDFLNFYIDNVLKSSISGESGWLSVSNQIPLGSHILKWQYTKDDIFFSGSDQGWLDQVEYVRVPPAAVTNLALQLSGGNAVVSFTSQTGYVHAVEWRTNWTADTWTVLTNFSGDNTLRTFNFPVGDRTESYYRVRSQ